MKIRIGTPRAGFSGLVDSIRRPDFATAAGLTLYGARRMSADGSLEVVDYKTGKTKPRAADVETNLQLSTYYLTATRDAALAGWGPPTQLRLLHVSSMTPFDQEVRPDHEAATEARILGAAEHILDEEFEPSVHADCDHCDYHRLCPLWPEGRHVGEAV